MKSLLEKLDAYIAANTREKILVDWEKTAEFDNVGVTVQEFMSGYSFSCVNKSNNQTEYTCNPENTSGFFITKIGQLCKICHKLLFQ